jgi:hypothetical protein
VPRTPEQRSRLSIRRLLGGLLTGVGLLALIGFLQPPPDRQEGATYCIPWLGPRISLARGLSDSARTPVAAHEAVHAAQCRSMGSWRFYAAHWRTGARLRLEAEAGCAEAHQRIALGRRADFAFEELVDDLVYAVPRGLGPGPDMAREAAVAACPELGHAAAATTLPPSS